MHLHTPEHKAMLPNIMWGTYAILYYPVITLEYKNTGGIELDVSNLIRIQIIKKNFKTPSVLSMFKLTLFSKMAI